MKEVKKEKKKLSFEERMFDVAFWSFLTVLPFGSAAAILYYANK
jgi:hypothetical protein